MKKNDKKRKTNFMTSCHEITTNLKKQKFITSATLQKRGDDVIMKLTICDEQVIIYIHFREDENDININNQTSRRVDIRASAFIPIPELRQVVIDEVYSRFLGFTSEIKTRKIISSFVKEDIIEGFKSVTAEQDISGYDAIVIYKGISIPIDITTNKKQKILLRKRETDCFPGLLKHTIPILDVGGVLKRTEIIRKRLIAVCEEFILRDDATYFLDQLNTESEKIELVGVEKYLQERKRKRITRKRIFFVKKINKSVSE